MRPPGRGILRHVLGDPRHIDIDQQADIGVGQRLGRHEPAMAGRIVRQVEMNGTEFDDADAGKLRQLVEQRDRGGIAARIGRDQKGLLGSQQPGRDGIDRLAIDGAHGCRAKTLLGIGADLALGPELGQRLAREGHVDRPLGVAHHHRVGPAQRLLGDHARGQVVFPFCVRPDQRRLVERLLDEVHVGVARPQKLAARGVGSAAGHQQNRDAGAADIVQGHRRIGGAGIDMHHHALAATGREEVARCHVRRRDLVRADHGLGRLSAVALEGGHRLDDRRVVGAEVAEDVVAADLGQAFEEILRRRAAGLVDAVHRVLTQRVVRMSKRLIRPSSRRKTWPTFVSAKSLPEGSRTV